MSPVSAFAANNYHCEARYGFPKVLNISVTEKQVKMHVGNQICIADRDPAYPNAHVPASYQSYVSFQPSVVQQKACNFAYQSFAKKLGFEKGAFGFLRLEKKMVLEGGVATGDAWTENDSLDSSSARDDKSNYSCAFEK